MNDRVHDHEFTIASLWVWMILAMLVAPGAAAQWVRSPGTNTAVCAASGNQVRPRIVQDGPGGTIVTWIDARSQRTSSSVVGWIAAQRFSHDGIPAWEQNGRLIDTTRLYQSLSSMAVDGSGGAYLCGIETGTLNVVLHRVTADGGLPWGMAGVLLGRGIMCALATDGSGGVLVAWENRDSIHVQRVGPNAAQYWTSPGLFLFRGTLGDVFCTNAGSTVIVATDTVTSSILAQKVSPEGATLWGSGGIVIGQGLNPAGVAHGDDRCVVAWSIQTPDYQYAVYGQQISPSGIPEWSPGGIPLCPGRVPVLVNGLDGETIAIGGTNEYPRLPVRAQCVNAQGKLQWEPDGVWIAEGYTPVAVADDAGGVNVVWSTQDPKDYSANHIYAQRLDRAGVRRWAAGGVYITTAQHQQRYPVAVSDNDHGVIVAWEDYRNHPDYYYFSTPYNSDIYAQRIRGVGHLGITDTSPVVTGMLPIHGIVGTPVEIRGSHFSPVVAECVVRFGGSRALVVKATDSLLQVFAPHGNTYAASAVTVGGLTGYGRTPFLSTSSITRMFTEALFGTAVALETGSYPWSVDVGDLNDDGKQDIVIAVYDRNVVAVQFNTGKMAAGQPLSFAPAIELPTHLNPTGVSIADVDGDGLLDILAACEGDNTVCMFQNTSVSGSLGFGPAFAFPVGSKPKGAVCADLNGDGRPEVITSNGGGQSISILLNRCDMWGITDSCFAAAIDQPVGLGPVGALVHDFDGDLRPDVAVACGGLQSVVVLRNTSSSGTIGFAAPISYPCGGAPGRMVSGDVDGDGLLDIAVALTDGSSVTVIRNSSNPGAISFDPNVQFETGIGAWCVAASDLNGDARIDLAVANYHAGTISLLQNTSVPGHLGTSSFASAVTLAIGGKPLHLVISDFNGDGLGDIIAADRTGEKVCVLKGLEPSPPPLKITSFSPLTVRPGDVVTINGSGFSTNLSQNNVRIGQMAAEILDSEPTRITARVNTGSSTGAIRVTTMGRMAFSSRPLQVTFPTAGMMDSTAFQDPYTLGLGIVERSGFNDCDGDGRPEMLRVPINSPNSSPFFAEARLFRNRSDSRTISFEQVPLPYYAITYPDVVTGAFLWNDVDCDGRDDLLFPSHYRTLIMRNTSTPGMPSFSGGGTVWHGGKTAQSVILNDFDGDGKIDLLCFNSSPVPPLFLRNSSIQGWINSESFIPMEISEFIDTPQGVADLDVDGLPDLVVTRVDSGSGPTLGMYRNTCSSGVLSFSPPLVLAGENGTLSVMDIDGDDLQDLIIAGTTGVLIHRNTSHSGSISFALPTQVSTVGAATLGDVTGDGLPDIIAVTDTVAHVHANNSMPGAISFAQSGVFRCDGTIVGMEDMNGDGRSDVQIYRQRDSTIVILQSMSGIDPVTFGPELRIRGRYPLGRGFLDIDGDGVSDIQGQTGPYSGHYALHRNRIGDRYTLRATADSGGMIYPSGDVQVLHGGEQAFTITPNPGFVLDSLLVDGMPVDSTTSYTLLRVISDHTIFARFISASDVDEQNVPHEFCLLQNFPNPFNPETVIRFSVGARGKATLTLFSLLGQEVERLFNGNAEPGRWYDVQLRAGRLASGIYFYRLQVRPLDSTVGRDSKGGAGDFVQTHKLLLVK